MHPLYDYVAKQLAEQIKRRRIVVWYDAKGDFEPFVREARGGARKGAEPAGVNVGGVATKLAEYAGSMLEVRAAVEPIVREDSPEALVVYVPGVEHDEKTSMLRELECAGTSWKPQLRTHARNVLLQRYTLGVVDEMLPFERKLTYEDLARACAEKSKSEPPSILKTLFHETTGSDGLLAAWLVSDARDPEIEEKDAKRELVKLLRSRLGLALPEDAPLGKVRAVTLRYTLANEFRNDLLCPPPACLESVPPTPGKEELSAVQEMARRLRASFPEAYPALADRVEDELGLRNAKLPAGQLGAIDTFRFEERALLGHSAELLANRQFEEALRIVDQREHSFWLDRDVTRKAQWEACRRMAELGREASSVRAALAKANGDADAWVEAYTGKEGWHRLDLRQRRLEAWISNLLLDDVEERALGVVRRDYEDACHAMAEGFTKALAKAGWTLSTPLHQTRIWSEAVAPSPKPVAYFLVDAMRFEMGVELSERLPRSSEVSLRAAVTALPSITTVGMAALQPGASGSFAVVEQGGKLGAKIDEGFLPDLAARKKHAAARVPMLVDLTLDEVLTLPGSKLAKKVEGAQVIVVRSQEIDDAGEKGFMVAARQTMDTVIDNLARAIRKLANAGVEHAVVTADHGHLFYAVQRDESMRTDEPKGQKVELHRRCWVGRGGATPPGCVRVSAASLGYASDLEMVFPAGSGVFRSGGDLAFHHGGPSLQEMVIPVLHVRTKGRETAKSSSVPIAASGLPDTVTNRIFSVTFVYGEKQLSLGGDAIVVRPMLMSGEKQVGAAGMAVDGEIDRATGCVMLRPNKPVTVAFLVTDESVAALRVVVQDPASDATLYRSPTDIPVRFGV